VAIVGSGPAGFYTAKYLLDKHATLSVDILEALPTPFGLVRHGVAPDHPEVKSVTSTFTEVAEHPRCRFFGNVRVGAAADAATAGAQMHVPLASLRQAYDVVVLAYGAASDAPLSVPGEDLPGVLSARAFVNWYNGHPAYRDLAVDLSRTRRVVIVGQGNVAIDCARILAKRPDDLAGTDVAPHALAALRHSAVEEVVVIGRRGHVQASFTIKEIRELTKIDGCALHISEDELAAGKTPASDAELTDNRPKLRIVELLAKIAAEGAEGAAPVTRAVHLRFLLGPTEIVADHGTVAAIQLAHNRLEGDAHRQRAVPTGTSERLPCQLVLKSVGYRSEPLAGAPFDSRTRTVPNVAGRVVERAEGAAAAAATTVVPGLYVSGWLKRGPSGIIGTNITDAKETVACILEDLRAAAAAGGGPVAPRPPLAALSAPEVVTWADYQRIDREERARGEGLTPPKPREKICSVDELLRVAKQHP